MKKLRASHWLHHRVPLQAHQPPQEIRNLHHYRVVRSLDLSGTAFDFIRTEVPGAGVDCTVTDPDTAVNPRAFYWVLPE